MSIPKVIANFTTSLADKLSKGDTSLTLVSISSKHGDLVAGYYGITIDEGQSTEEHVIGLLNPTTKTLSGLIRDVSVIDGITNSSTGQDHRKAAEAKITDAPVLIQITRILNGEAKLDPAGVLGYTGQPAAFGDADLVTKKFVADNYLGVNENDEVAGDLIFTGLLDIRGTTTFTEKIIANGGLESVTPIQAADPVNSNDVATKAFVLAQAFGSTLISGLNSPEINYNEDGLVQSVHDVDSGLTFVFIYSPDGELEGIYDGTNSWVISRASSGQLLAITKH